MRFFFWVVSSFVAVVASAHTLRGGSPKPFPYGEVEDHQIAQLIQALSQITPESHPELAADLADRTPKNTIPDGVQCNETTVCDKYGFCSIVCARGSVEIDPWLQGALKSQIELAQNEESLCYTTMLGTHNSLITLADGYGNEDQVWDKIVGVLGKIWPWTKVQTNDQYFSITDQLNLGVRMIEVDNHFFLGDLHVAHCGGVNISAIDHIVDELNAVIEKFGLELRWESDVIGCLPSLSGIPASEQRTFVDGLTEINDWLTAHPDEFLIIMLDEEMDLQDFGVVDMLVSQIASVIDTSLVFTPADRDAFQAEHNRYPNLAELKAANKSYLITSGADYGDAMYSLIFPKNSEDAAARPCGWREPKSSIINPYPTCTDTIESVPTYQGFFVRPESSEIMYGPVNGGGGWGANDNLLNETTIPDWMACGVNSPSPDMLTPERASTFIWSWSNTTLEESGDCTKLSAASNRWHLTSCDDDLSYACLNDADNTWNLDTSSSCANGGTFTAPRNGWLQSGLLVEMNAAGVDEVFVNAAWPL